MKSIWTAACIALLGGVLFAGTYSGGEGEPGNPWQIANINDLQTLSTTTDDWNRHFIQTADIDASATSEWNSKSVGGGYYGFSPIGNATTSFSGSYNGQGYTIDGLYISRYINIDNERDIGFFGQISNAYIANVHLKNIDITGSKYVGGLIGTATSTSKIIKCSAEGDVKGRYIVGGLIGKILWGSTISICYSSGTVSGYSSVTSSYIGGFAGELAVSNFSSPSIGNSYSRSNVSGDNDIGGFLGYIDNGAVDTCYCTSSVSTEGSTFGGFIGNSSGTHTVGDCFWDVETDGISGNASGADNYGATGKNTSEMTNTTPVNNIYLQAGWDFTGESANGTEEIWNMGSSYNNNYPFLSWEHPEADTPLPVCLASFSAKVINGAVHVTWTTESETENAHFLLYRNGDVVTQIAGAGTSTEPCNYGWTDQYVVPGRTYGYVLADVNYQGEETGHAALEVVIKVENSLNKGFNIGTAYPNPFNPLTIVPLNLTKETMVKATLYDITGRSLLQLQNGIMCAGSHDLMIHGSNLNTGIYFVHIVVNEMTHVQKVVLMK